MNPVERARTIAALIAIAAAIVATRPYLGIYHDAQLYMAQALRSGGAGGLAGDLTFRFGNQQGFSLFDTVYAPLVGALGPSGAHMLGWYLGLFLWAVALVLLLRRIELGPRALPAVAVGVLLMNPAYGPGVLSYAEGFVTPRVFAEALAMVALARLLRGDRVSGALAWVVSAALHPLMALPAGVAGLWLWVRSGWSFLLVLMLGSALAAGLGFAGLPPFDWLLLRMDAQWLAVLRSPDHLGFPETWPPHSALTLPLPLVALGLAARGDPGPLKDLARAVLVTALLAAAVTFIGITLLENRLITALQPWRALWLLTLAGNMAAAAMAVKGPGATWWRLAVGMSILEHLLGVTPFASALAALAPICALLPGRAGRWTAAVPAVLATLALATVPFALRPDPETWLYLALALVALAVVVLPPDLGWAQIALACGLAVGAVWLFDARDDWRRWADAPVLPEPIASALEGKAVYWEGAHMPMWLGSGQPQFFSCRQKSGSLFYREQAMEFQRRAEALRPLGTGDFQQPGWPGCPPAPEGGGARDADTLGRVCAALPELDLIVLLPGAPDTAAATWTLPVATARFEQGVWQGDATAVETQWQVYDCAEFRAR